MFLVSWEGGAPPDKNEWLAALRQALADESGSYRVLFRRGEGGWRFGLEYRSEVASEHSTSNEPDEGVALSIYTHLARRGVPIDPGWHPRGVGPVEAADPTPADVEAEVPVLPEPPPRAPTALTPLPSDSPAPDAPSPATVESSEAPAPAMVESSDVQKPAPAAPPAPRTDAAPSRPFWHVPTLRRAGGRVLTMALAVAVVWLVWDRRKAPAPTPAAPTAEALAAQARLRELETIVARLQAGSTENTSRAPTEPSPSPKTVAAAARGERGTVEPATASAASIGEAVEVTRVPEDFALSTPTPPRAPLPRPTPTPTPRPLLAPPEEGNDPPPAPSPPSVERGAMVAANDPEVTLPIVLAHAQPLYPPLAQARGIEGTVILSALVDENGDVAELSVVRVVPRGLGFDDAAVEYVKSRRYQPATKRGVPVRVRLEIVVEFRKPAR